MTLPLDPPELNSDGGHDMGDQQQQQQTPQQKEQLREQLKRNWAAVVKDSPENFSSSEHETPVKEPSSSKTSTLLCLSQRNFTHRIPTLLEPAQARVTDIASLELQPTQRHATGG
ncbi:hypothetical protein Q7P37_005218 [Cladosporium fusiforme]